MALTNQEFEAIINNTTKVVVGDIAWTDDDDHSPSCEFKVEVQSDAGWPLFVKGSFNPAIPALSFALILKTEGRIYALDLGKDHHNPQCNQVGDKHKHRWTEQFRDKEAYVPDDITEPASDPVAVWRQFCAEAKMTHQGTMHQPRPWEEDLLV